MLEDVLADWAQKITILRSANALITPDTLDAFRREVAKAAEPHVRRLNETDAHLYSGKSVRWLRDHFAELEAQGNAGRTHGVRWYRMGALPIRVNVQAAIDDARRTADTEARTDSRTAPRSAA